MTLHLRPRLRAPWPCIRPSHLLALGASLTLIACGGGSDGAAVRATAQTLQVEAPAALQQGQSTSVRASASSGLKVSYTTSTPSTCYVSSDGQVSALSSGMCVITVSQAGNPDFAPASPLTVRFPVSRAPLQVITFDAAPPLSLGGTATVIASASSGLAINYSSLTPSVCDVVASTGLVQSLSAGSCTIAADQPGDLDVLPAPQATVTMSVATPSVQAVPAAPQGIAISANDAADGVTVSASATDSGGSLITHYTIRSGNGAIQQTATTLPTSVSCAGACAGLSFTVSASNALGEGAASPQQPIVTTYRVVTTFEEPDTQPRNTVFTGTFTLNATTSEVSNLQGTLTESMTGDPTSAGPGYGMAVLTLSHQLSSIQGPGLAGMLVTTFYLNTRDTFTTRFGGDGWSPGTGLGLYAGYPGATNPSRGGVGNAYVRIFVNPVSPTSPLSQAQIDKLAYADCTARGMMGATCMTGTTVAGYGSVGTMSGQPLSQVVTRLH